MLETSQLAGLLKPLDIGSSDKLSEPLLGFYQYYGIDFSRRWPELLQCSGYIESGNYRIASYVYRQPSAQKNLILVHGYFDHSGLFGHLIEYGLSRGFNVVVFDLPGHGLSTGKALIISDFENYVQAFRDCLNVFQTQLPGRWQVIAQSTGCSTVMDYLLHNPDIIFERAILLAPLVRLKRWRQIKLAYSVCKYWLDYVPRSFSNCSHDQGFLELLRRDPLQVRKISVQWVGALIRWVERFLSTPPSDYSPLLIQGTGDSTVDWQYNIEQIEQKFPRSKVSYLEGARHHLANENESIRQAQYKIMDAYILGS